MNEDIPLTLQDDIATVVAAYVAPSPDKTAHVAAVAEGMLTRPRSDSIERPLSVDEVVKLVGDYGFADWNQPLGWVRRDGFVMPVTYIRHDMLLYFLGMHVVDAEDRGWLRIGQSSWQCLYRLTPAQKRALAARGHVVDTDAERLKKPWHGLPPYPDTVHKSRRIPR